MNPKNWNKYDDNFILELIDLKCYDEVHDIYSPRFSDESEIEEID